MPAEITGGALGQSAEDVRAFAFGDLAGGPCGIAWIPPHTPAIGLLAAASGTGTEAEPEPLELEGHDAQEPWRVRSAEMALTLDGLEDPVWTELPGQAPGFDQLCRVSGELQSGQHRAEISALGWRSARPAPLGPQRGGTLRQVAAWFDPGDGFALLALRPRDAPGQDRDRVSAAVFTPGGGRSVAEPRLSTTYLASGQPARSTVELWIEAEGDPDTQYPRRAIGEALGASHGWSTGNLTLEAQLFRWSSTGREGTGLYLLGRLG